MHCEKCGHELEENGGVCTNCGAPAAVDVPAPGPQAYQTPKKAKVVIIIGIVGLLYAIGNIALSRFFGVSYELPWSRYQIFIVVLLLISGTVTVAAIDAIRDTALDRKSAERERDRSGE